MQRALLVVEINDPWATDMLQQIRLAVCLHCRRVHDVGFEVQVRNPNQRQSSCLESTIPKQRLSRIEILQ